MQNFFNSDVWRDVEHALSRAPFIARDGNTHSVFEPTVAVRLLENRLKCIRLAGVPTSR